MPEPVAALVVGAGPAGSATALRLSRSGQQVTLIDKASFPRDKCCSEYASPQTCQEIAALGVSLSERLPSRTALAGTVVHGPRQSQLTGRFAASSPPPPTETGTTLRRLEFDAAMLAAASSSGATVREQTRLVSLERRPDGLMAATIESDGHRETLLARVVIGADGIRSRVARLAGLARRGSVDRLAFVAHMIGVAAMTDLAELHVAHDGYVGLNPLDANVTNVALVIPASEATAARGDPAAFLRNRLALDPVLAPRLANATLVNKVMTTGPFDCRSSSSTAPGIALVGDAADFFDPFTGDGIRSALVGARLLTNQLVPLLGGDRPITVRDLRGYRSARRREFAGKWIFERALGHAMRWPHLFDAFVARLERARLGATMVAVAGGSLPAARLLGLDTLGRLALPSGNF